MDGCVWRRKESYFFFLGMDKNGNLIMLDVILWIKYKRKKSHRYSCVLILSMGLHGNLSPSYPDTHGEPLRPFAPSPL